MGSSLAPRKRGPLSELGVPNFGEGVLPPSARWTPSLSAELRGTLAKINKINPPRSAHQSARSFDYISNYIFW